MICDSGLLFWATLYAAGLSLEDNGNYTCEISGPHNALLGFVTHRIFVRGNDTTSSDSVQHLQCARLLTAVCFVSLAAGVSSQLGLRLPILLNSNGPVLVFCRRHEQLYFPIKWSHADTIKWTEKQTMTMKMMILLLYYY